MHLVLYILGGLLGLLTIMLAMIGFQHVTRGTPVHRVRGAGRSDGDGTPSVDDDRFCEMIELLTDTVLKPGHKVEIFTCGNQTYPRLFEDIRSARTAIAVQMYYCKPGKVADEMQATLIERARAGVKVLFLHDAFGAQALPAEYHEQMREAGVEVATFRPVRWWDLHKANSRSHIRVVVVDGRVGWTGGFGLDDKWLGDGRSEDQWRDTNTRFEGPAVLQHMATFADGWAEATGVLLTSDTWFPSIDAPESGGVVAGAHHAAPTIGSTLGERFLALSIAGAKKKLYISNSYFVPDDDFRQLLCEAVKRGVDVRILTPGEKTDTKFTWLAGRATYDELLSNGVKLYEYQPVMMHAKTIVADGCWGSVGTMNFDNRSLAFNDESNLLFSDETLGGQLERIFLEDLAYAKEMRLDEWRRRPRLDRFKEKGAQSIQRIL